MIFGIGTDIVDIPRVRLLILKPGFLNKIYTQQEQEYLKRRRMNAETAAGMFAVKEACAKALGRGFDYISWKDIEVMHNEYGQPYVNLYGTAKELFDKNNCSRVFVSISHVRIIAVAQCIIEC